MPVKGLRERLADGEYVLAAEGYLFEMERRGFLKAGPFVPEVVVEHPELVRGISEEFAHAGSDVTLAFTYYGHREKLRLISRETDLETLNRSALKIAREVADKTQTLMAGNICNSTCFDPNDPVSVDNCKAMFKEQVEWAVAEDADLIVAETYMDYKEASLALEAIRTFGNGLPSVINIAANISHLTRDGLKYSDACKKLEDQGADVVGLNCCFGPKTIIPEMREVRKVCKGPLSCLPVPYRTTPQCPLMQSLVIPNKNEIAFFEDLDYFCCPQSDMTDFAKDCKEVGIQYIGICCGNSSRYFRRLAEGLGRTVPASRYTTDMSLHWVYGNKGHFNKYDTEKLRVLADRLEGVLVNHKVFQ